MCFEPDLDPKIAPKRQKNSPEDPKKVQKRPKMGHWNLQPGTLGTRVAGNPLSGRAKTSGFPHWRFLRLCLETSKSVIITTYTRDTIERSWRSKMKKIDVSFGSVSEHT